LGEDVGLRDAYHFCTVAMIVIKFGPGIDFEILPHETAKEFSGLHGIVQELKQDLQSG
jgi:hypothetical protein